MGTINYTIHNAAAGNAFLVRWASLSTGTSGGLASGAADTGIPFPSSIDLALGGALYSDKSVQVFTYVNTGATTRVIIQGSNNMTVTESDGRIVWATLTDAQGNPLQFDNGAGTGNFYRIEEVLENPYYIRPVVTSVTDAVLASQTTTVDLLITSVRSTRSAI